MKRLIENYPHRNKKAIVLPEVLRIIIAVACIILLVYIAAKLYTILTRNHELEQAKSNLETIVSKANSLKEGESYEYMITGPKGWRIMAYSNEKKVCICPAYESDRDKEIQQNLLCEKQGACKNVAFIANIGGSNNICKIERKFFSGEYTLNNCLAIDKIPKKIILYKNSGAIILSDSISSGGVETRVISVNGKVYDEKGGYREITFSVEKFKDGNALVISFLPYLKYTGESATTNYNFYFKSTDDCESALYKDKTCIPIYIDEAGSYSDSFVGEIYPDNWVWLSQTAIDKRYTFENFRLYKETANGKPACYEHSLALINAIDNSLYLYCPSNLAVNYNELLKLIQELK
jgi:hypothetical protein